MATSRNNRSDRPARRRRDRDALDRVYASAALMNGLANLVAAVTALLSVLG